MLLVKFAKGGPSNLSRRTIRHAVYQFADKSERISKEKKLEDSLQNPDNAYIQR